MTKNGFSKHAVLATLCLGMGKANAEMVLACEPALTGRGKALKAESRFAAEPLFFTVYLITCGSTPWQKSKPKLGFKEVGGDHFSHVALR